MKLECRTKNLKDAIQKAQKITVKNSTLPVLNSILIKALDKSIVVRSTNLHLGVEVEIPANVEKDGEFLVSGETISRVFSTIPDSEQLSISVEGTVMKINTSKNAISINSSGESNEFPTLPVVEGTAITLPLKTFLDGVKSVYYCAAISDIKPEISSVYVFSDSNELVFVSTDSFRLAEKRVVVDGLPDIDGMLIPYKNVIELIKLFGEEDVNVELRYNDNQLTLSIPGLFVTSRVVNGSYPNYQMIIPKEFKTEVVALKQDVLDALKLSTIFSDKFNQINLHLDSTAKSLVMKAKNSQKGENISQIDASINGESIEMNFNHRYFHEAFQSVFTDSVVLQFNEDNKPVIVRGVGDKSFLYLIMPMNR